LNAQAVELFLKRSPDGKKKANVRPPNLATPRNMLPLLRAQRDWLVEFADWAKVYGQTKSILEVMPGVTPYAGPFQQAVIEAMPASLEKEGQRALDRYEHYVETLEANESVNVCLEGCALEVTEPWLMGWRPGFEYRTIPDIQTPLLLARTWGAGLEVWGTTVVEATLQLPVDIAEEIEGRAADVASVSRWVLDHPWLAVGAVLGSAAAVAAAVAAAPAVAAAVARRIV
jgi:hypothetical protein